MRAQGTYNNKFFSVFGDSMSTLSRYSEPEEAVFYQGARQCEADIFTPQDTWWGQIIEALGGRLLVNHSISGSMVIKHRLCMIPSYGCSDQRAKEICREGQAPDVVMIFLGSNDWGCGARPTPRNAEEEKDMAVFSVAYARMLENLRRQAPQAELWCFTLPVSICTHREGFVFPYRYAGRHIEAYNQVICTCAKAAGARVIDWYQADVLYDTVDGIHPNAEGMRTLSEAALRLL